MQRNGTLPGQRDSGRSQRRPPPSIPKRDPETRLSGTNEQFSQELKIHDMQYEGPPTSDFLDGAPESGYITPEGSDVDYNAGTQNPTTEQYQQRPQIASYMHRGVTKGTNNQHNGTPQQTNYPSLSSNSGSSGRYSNESTRSNSHPPPPPPMSTMPQDDEVYDNHIPHIDSNGVNSPRFYCNQLPNDLGYMESEAHYESVLPTPELMASNEPLPIVPPPPSMTHVQADIVPVPPPPPADFATPPSQFQNGCRPHPPAPHIPMNAHNGYNTNGTYNHVQSHQVAAHHNTATSYGAQPAQLNHNANVLNGHHDVIQSAPPPPPMHQTLPPRCPPAPPPIHPTLSTPMVPPAVPPPPPPPAAPVFHQNTSHVNNTHQQNHVSHSYKPSQEATPSHNMRGDTLPPPPPSLLSTNQAAAAHQNNTFPPPPSVALGHQIGNQQTSPTKPIPKTMPKPKPKPSSVDTSAAGIVQNEMASTGKLPPVLARLQKPAESEPNRPAPSVNGGTHSDVSDGFNEQNSQPLPPPPPVPAVAAKVPPPPPSKPSVSAGHAVQNSPTQHFPPPPPPVPQVGDCAPLTIASPSSHAPVVSSPTTPIDLTTMPAGRTTTQSTAPTTIDITTLPGYQEVPDNVPQWKKAMIEKKNRELYDKAMSDIMQQQAEQEKWRDIPSWKKNLLQDKEKRKAEELAPLEADRKARDMEMQRLGSMPEWKRNLILKKKGDI